MRLPLLLLLDWAMVCICAMVFTCAMAFGADLTGSWTGTIAVDDAGSGTTITTQVHVELQQKGEGLSGKIGRVEDTDVVPIKNARMEGDTLVFEAASDETTGPMKFSLKIAGDQMEGTMKGSIDSGDINGKVKLTREKTNARNPNPTSGRLIATLSIGCDSPPTCIKS